MKVLKWLDKYIEEVLLVILLVSMVLVMVAQIIMRHLFASSFSWAEEVTRYIFIWSGFISISYALKNKTAMRLTPVVASMPRKTRHITLLFQYVIIVAFFGYMTAVSIVQMGSMKQVSAALEIPMNFIYISTTIGFILTVVRCLQAIIVIVKNFDKNHDLDLIK